MISWLSEKKTHKCYVLPYENSYKIFVQNKGLINAYEHSGIEVISPIPFFSIKYFIKTLRTARRLRRFIRQNEVDAIVISFLEPSALWTIFRNYFNVPIVLYAYGTDVLKTIPAFFQERSLFKRFIASLYIRAFQKADFVAGTSISQLDSIKRFSGYTKKMAVVRTGVDIGKINLDTTSYLPERLKNAEKIVFFPRSMYPLYNHELALEAIRLLSNTIKEKCAFVFVNNDSPAREYVNKINTIIGQLKDTTIYFLGSQSQEAMFELYKRASLVVMTPLSDGSPVSAMEALLCKTPVILPPLDYDRDLFSEGVYILRSREPVELSTAINKILTGEIKLNAEAAMAIMLQKADRNKEMNKLNEIIKAIVSGSFQSSSEVFQ
jgi:glycosyltransferase involved in cell wall biosynthesis